MQITIITLLPTALEPYLQLGMLGKAQRQGLIRFELVDLRQFGLGSRRQVDDTPYGGGPGMILRLEPLVAALESLTLDRATTEIILLTPRGRLFDQDTARRLAGGKQHLVLICGRYEGYDERLTNWVDSQLSIGNYVLTGGEIPALVVADAVSRLRPGVLGGEASLAEESFADGQTAEYPQYTKPPDFRGLKVPSVLLSGHHQQISDWRSQQTQL